MTLDHAVHNAQRRADTFDRRFVVWKSTRTANGYTVLPFGERPPAHIDVKRGSIYVAVPGHVPSPGDGVTPYYCEMPTCDAIPVPGVSGVQLPDGTILCNACDRQARAVEDRIAATDPSNDWRRGGVS